MATVKDKSSNQRLVEVDAQGLLTTDDMSPHISCSSSVISEFNRKLYDIDHSLSLDMQPAVGFLCLAVCPKSCIYPRNVRQTPTIMCCYNGLRDFSVTQRITVSLLLHFLCLVGCLQNFIDELQRSIGMSSKGVLESQLAADVKDINQLPPDSKKRLDFHEFLLSIYRELSDEEWMALIEKINIEVSYKYKIRETERVKLCKKIIKDICRRRWWPIKR